MVINGVSDILLTQIKQFSLLLQLADFNLGGGTNLAIKYNHRVSTDIDFFSQKVVGVTAINDIASAIQENFKPIFIEILNKNHQILCFIRAILPTSGIKVEIIQNLKNLKEPQEIQGIRLIHDDDIGALKLLAAASRGTQKDFYDLHLLTELKPLGFYYDHLMNYFEKNKEQPSNIFDHSGSLEIDLKNDLTPLCDFNRSGDKKNASNRIILTDDSPIKIIWPILREKWKNKVEELAKMKNLKFGETPHRRKPKFPRFF